MKVNRPQFGTCLAVVKDDDGYLYFASDRRESWGYHKAAKMEGTKSSFRNGILLMGTGNGFLCSEVIQYMPVVKLPKKINPDVYMHDHFMPNLLRYFKKENLLHPKERRLMAPDSVDDYMAIILVGVGDALYEVIVSNEHIQFDRATTPWAHGCGGSLAWGSLLTTQYLNDTQQLVELLDPTERLLIALDQAASVSPGCDNNVDIISNNPKFKATYLELD